MGHGLSRLVQSPAARRTLTLIASLPKGQVTLLAKSVTLCYHAQPHERKTARLTPQSAAIRDSPLKLNPGRQTGSSHIPLAAAQQ
jgi:hypothetical protein